jgi:hypothetical protein
MGILREGGGDKPSAVSPPGSLEKLKLKTLEKEMK